ncbi:hypothetical protein M9458_036571, partial [Cirrhinus mrigala]
QFNLIPPVCEQAEYHLFQREKLYHKIGRCQSIIIYAVNLREYDTVSFREFISESMQQLLILAINMTLILLGTVGVGAMTWSPLACGIITGKYENGIPESSRAAMK